MIVRVLIGLVIKWLELIDDTYEFGVIPDDWDALAED